MWETHRQPRLHLSRLLAHRIDRSTARAVEMWLIEGAHGVSSALLDLPDASVTEMMMMCTPVPDRGAAPELQRGHPGERAALRAVEHLALRGRRAVGGAGQSRAAQHRGGNAQLRAGPRAPLPNAVQTHLEPGDGVVYILPILHWGQRLPEQAAPLHPQRLRALRKNRASRSSHTCRHPRVKRSRAGRSEPTRRLSTPRRPPAPPWPAMSGRTRGRSTVSTRGAAGRATCSFRSTSAKRPSTCW